MIPDGVATVFAFFGFVAPGLVFHLVIERRIPRRDETAFRETSLIALSSVVFTTAALAVVVCARAILPDAFPDLQEWRHAGWGYVVDHPIWTTSAIIAIPVVASAFAGGAAWLLTRGKRAILKNNGAWFQALRLDRPETAGDAFVWMHVKLKDEYEYWGNLRAYTEDDSSPVREIVIGGSTMLWKPKGATKAQAIGEEWDAVILNAEDISFVRVAYQDAAGNLLGRKTPANPGGRKLTTPPRLATPTVKTAWWKWPACGKPSAS